MSYKSYKTIINIFLLLVSCFFFICGFKLGEKNYDLTHFISYELPQNAPRVHTQEDFLRKQIIMNKSVKAYLKLQGICKERQLSQRDVLSCDMFFYALYLAEESEYKEGFYDAYNYIEEAYKNYPNLRPKNERVKELRATLLKEGALHNSEKCKLILEHE